MMRTVVLRRQLSRRFLSRSRSRTDDAYDRLITMKSAWPLMNSRGDEAELERLRAMYDRSRDEILSALETVKASALIETENSDSCADDAEETPRITHVNHVLHLATSSVLVGDWDTYTRATAALSNSLKEEDLAREESGKELSEEECAKAEATVVMLDTASRHMWRCLGRQKLHYPGTLEDVCNITNAASTTLTNFTWDCAVNRHGARRATDECARRLLLEAQRYLKRLETSENKAIEMYMLRPVWKRLATLHRNRLSPALFHAIEKEKQRLAPYLEKSWLRRHSLLHYCEECARDLSYAVGMIRDVSAAGLKSTPVPQQLMLLLKEAQEAPDAVLQEQVREEYLQLRAQLRVMLTRRRSSVVKSVDVVPFALCAVRFKDWDTLHQALNALKENSSIDMLSFRKLLQSVMEALEACHNVQGETFMELEGILPDLWSCLLLRPLFHGGHTKKCAVVADCTSLLLRADAEICSQRFADRAASEQVRRILDQIPGHIEFLRRGGKGITYLYSLREIWRSLTDLYLKGENVPSEMLRQIEIEKKYMLPLLEPSFFKECGFPTEDERTARQLRATIAVITGSTPGHAQVE
ncbi:MAG: hypothetical protein MHM6MM_001475 [Cercozoa sp. M6MM]